MRFSNDRGYAMAALLVGLSVMGIMLSMALPVWRTAATREREAELVFRGEQYAQAIELFSRRNGGFPLNLDVLEEGRYIRKLYKDPMTPDGEFQPVYFGQPLPGQIADPERRCRSHHRRGQYEFGGVVAAV
jgi:type II secretory pathway pseudopilin PulG